MKFATFATAPDGQDRDAFQQWFAREYVTALLAATPTSCGCVIRRAIDAPRVEGMPAMVVDPKDVAPCDILMELWLPSSEDFRREVLPVEKRLRDIGAQYVSYSVYPRLQKDPRIAEAGAQGSRPEVTWIGAVKWLPGVTREFAAEQWMEHTSVALRTQPWMTKYEQNLVTEVISWTPGAPAIDAFGDFSFRTVDELANGFVYTLEEEQDVSNFVGVARQTYFGDAEPFWR